MMTPGSLAKIDAYLGAMIDRALAGASTQSERAALLQQGLALSRYLGLGACRRPLQSALERGEAPGTLAELLAFVEPRRQRWRKLTRQSQRLVTAGKQRANRSSERLFPPTEVARELGIGVVAVTSWCQKGLLPSSPDAHGIPQIPASALYAYRTEQARWKRLETVSAAARAGEPAPDEAAVFAEMGLRRA